MDPAGYRPPAVRPELAVKPIYAALLALLVFGCAPAAPPGTSPATAPPAESRRGGVVRIALWQEPAILNPLLGNQTVTNLVSRTMIEGLASFQPDGSAGPGLAEVPSLDKGTVSPDGLTVTWKLRPGVLWSDGAPFTSRDVAFTQQVIVNPANPVINRTGYSEIESIDTPDENTAVVKYRALYAGFKDHFRWVLPEHSFGGDTAIETSVFNHAPLGTG